MIFINKICIHVGGLLSILMFLFHTRFYKLFDWANELSKINEIQGRILYTIHFALLLFFLVFGILSFVYVDELARCEGLAFGLCLGYSLFWLWRSIWQITYFKIPKISQASKKGLVIYYFLLTLFIFLFVTYAIPVLTKIF